MVALKDNDYVVVWSGRDSLLPDREERADSRFAGMPSYDIDDGEKVDSGPKRRYVKTGKNKGIFSRTNPAAKSFKPGVTFQKENKNG